MLKGFNVQNRNKEKPVTYFAAVLNFSIPTWNLFCILVLGFWI
jgi:hypothetical protein